MHGNELRGEQLRDGIVRRCLVEKASGLGGGQPKEVWFDSDRSALGRVGYADGQIFTLPGGHQLALPIEGGGEVLDFENFGGWPVAFTTTGLWAAGWPLHADGGVNNRFDDGRSNRPMTWRALTLVDGATPWTDKKQGRLFTQRDDEGLRLLLFLDDQVWELARSTP